jgi:hypothetical protein
VPAEYAGARLTVKAYPERVCIYHHDKLIARHARSYDRHQDFEDPDHPKALLNARRAAREQHLLMRFLALSPRAQAYYEGLAQRRTHVAHHVRKIVALAELYGEVALVRAIDDGLAFAAFSCEYIANLLEMRARAPGAPAGALHLTRRADLLEIELDAPDLSIYGGRDDDEPIR